MGEKNYGFLFKKSFIKKKTDMYTIIPPKKLKK